jgi:cytochrome c biogenesis protein CcmG, thiol:disulfide interchange protein DsbE
MNRWIKLAAVAVLAVAAGQLLFRGSDPGVDAGGKAPPLMLPDLQGKRVDLSALRGRVVAVNFWASWCGPCQVEIPELAQVWAANRDRCFELLGVAEESAPQDLRAMAPSIPYPILVDARAELLTPWRVEGYPRTYLVDAEGNLRRVFVGALRRQQLEDAIRPLLPATCPARS